MDPTKPITFVDLSLTEIAQRLKAMELPEVDGIVGIAAGGTVPASLVAYQLDRPLSMIQLNYRGEDNLPLYDSPQVIEAQPIDDAQRRVLLVDDVSVSGKTLSAAKDLLGDRAVTTLVITGEADYVVFPEVGDCVNWPWNPNT
ncbi:MAG: phosphoribosyltransferase [Chloroflexi bacterium]|nr:phosphoribosyltransferase [Chloroflexota bacterium]